MKLRRLLDVLVPSFNRPSKLYHLLETGVRLGVPPMHFVVIDDGSTLAEQVGELGEMDTEAVCRAFPEDRVTYLRNETNIGLAAALARYYASPAAEFTMLVNDKDEFVDGRPILNALEKLQADPTLSIVMIPLRQVDRVSEDRHLLFQYQQMSGSDFIASYVRDTMLQHAGMYGVMRVDAIRRAGVPRSLGLRRWGLEDAFGIDVDFLLSVATTGNVEFEQIPHVRRSVIGGLTERFPLTFAYSYYQYAKRIMDELQQKGIVARKTVRIYIAWWLLLISRGLVVSYRPVHGTEGERGTSRIKPHMQVPIAAFLAREMLTYRITPSLELIQNWGLAVRRYRTFKRAKSSESRRTITAPLAKLLRALRQSQ